MPTTINETVPRELAEANLHPRGAVQPSPRNWRDQVLYFLLPDRFSDDGEQQRSLFSRNHPEAFAAADRGAWQRSGRDWQGGTLAGIRSKLDYLQGLGVTALWVGPVWKQRSELDTYHGYGIQNFLDVDPRFGNRQELRDLVDAAHERGMYVLLDIIFNHSGNNWFYERDGQPHTTLPYRHAPAYLRHGWRSAGGTSVAAIGGDDDGVWPREFQNDDWYTRAGQIGRWDQAAWEDPLHPETEFRRGDFYDLKDLHLEREEVLAGLIKVYQYWIALSDCDGFRIDTVKHVSREASRNFCGAIKEYAESLGKDNFLLLGEVTGGAAMARDYLEIFGRNLDAVLDIGLPAARLAGLAKGLDDPGSFFAQFAGHEVLGTHRQTGRYHVSILDDHDLVGRDKRRFAAGNQGPHRYEQAAHAVGLQLTTLGIPCVYYGTEQAFDGGVDRHDGAADPGFEDRFVREAMFGGHFGAFATAGCHFFDTDHPTYLRIAAVARLRGAENPVGLTLRRGRQYRRATSFLGRPFAPPGAGELIAWSRILHRQEVLVALNSHGDEARGAEVTVDAELHPPGTRLSYLYRGDWTDDQLRTVATGGPPPDVSVEVRNHGGRATVRIDLPPAGMAILG